MNLKMGPSKKRIIFSRVAIILIVLGHITIGPSFSEDDWYASLIESTGLLLIGIAILGRIWSSLFISGQKTHALVVEGPYSVVRNPLYFFSFLGALGAGLCSESIFTFTLIVLLFCLYYPFVVRNEENKLLNIHGETFVNYCKNVPRFFPNLSLYKCPVVIPIDTARTRKALLDCLGFFLIFPAFEMIEELHKVFNLNYLISSIF